MHGCQGVMLLSGGGVRYVYLSCVHTPYTFPLTPMITTHWAPTQHLACIVMFMLRIRLIQVQQLGHHQDSSSSPSNLTSMYSGAVQGDEGNNTSYRCQRHIFYASTAYNQCSFSPMLELSNLIAHSFIFTLFD